MYNFGISFQHFISSSSMIAPPASLFGSLVRDKPGYNNITSARCQASAALFWAITQRLVVIPYRRCGTTYRSHLPVSRIQEERKIFFLLFLDSWPLKKEPTGCPETCGRNYHYTLCNDPEERSSQCYFCFSQLQNSYLRIKYTLFMCVLLSYTP